jgi:hypothetical protein
MVVLGDENGDPCPLAGEPHVILHVKVVGYRLESGSDLLPCECKTVHLPFHTMKEDPLLGVNVLLGVNNIAAVAEHEIGNTGDQAFLVGTVNQKDGGFIGRRSSQARSQSVSFWMFYSSLISKTGSIVLRFRFLLVELLQRLLSLTISLVVFARCGIR